MKKAQAIALLGIAFIVIIIIFGLLFFLTHSLRNKGKTMYQSIQEEVLASGTIYVLMRTTIKCDNLICYGDKLKIEDLIRSCVKAGNCNLVESKLKEYLDFIFLSKGINYKFSVIYLGTTDIEIQEGEDCREKETGFSFIPLDNKNIELSLEVCE